MLTIALSDEERQRRAARAREYYQRNKERVIKYAKAWKARNPDKVLEHRSKQYAKARTIRAANGSKPKKLPALPRAPRKPSLFILPRGLSQNERLREINVIKAGRRPPHLCEICQREPSGNGKRLHFDHCHATGLFRGWICTKCNTSLGLMGENAEYIRKLADYIEAFKTRLKLVA